MKIKVPKSHPVQPLRKGQRAEDKAKLRAEPKPTTVWLVMQQGGASTEWYAHWFDSMKEANRYRVSADKATYDTMEPEEIWRKTLMS